MWIAIKHAVRVGDADTAQHTGRHGHRFGWRVPHGREHFGHLLTGTDRRVQRFAGILIHHRDGAAAEHAQLSVRQLPEIAAIDQHAAGTDAAVARQIAHGGQRSR